MTEALRTERLSSVKHGRSGTDGFECFIPKRTGAFPAEEIPDCGKRRAANLAVMEHRIRCELGNEETDKIARAARGEFGWRWDSRSVKAARRKARRVLTNLGVSAENLQGYRRLPLFAAACKKIERTLKAQAEAPIGLFARDAACACCPADRTAQA